MPNNAACYTAHKHCIVMLHTYLQYRLPEQANELICLTYIQVITYQRMLETQIKCGLPKSSTAAQNMFVKEEYPQTIDWLSMVLRLRQHNIGYTSDGFYRSDDPTNSVKALKEGG